jgi:NADH:ubiquinone oxidoreductase subunit 6 (subunit J)
MAGRQDIGAALSAFAVFAMMFLALSPAAGDLAPAPAETTVAALATELLGPQIVAFELAGGLLLLAFVAVIALAQGGSKR